MPSNSNNIFLQLLLLYETLPVRGYVKKTLTVIQYAAVMGLSILIYVNSRKKHAGKVSDRDFRVIIWRQNNH